MDLQNWRSFQIIGKVLCRTGTGPLLNVAQSLFFYRPEATLAWTGPAQPTSSHCVHAWHHPDSASKHRPPARRADRARCRSDARHLPLGLHAQHMQLPPLCTALHLTSCPYPLDAEAKPRLPSPLPRNTVPLPSPMRTPPLCTDDVPHDQITAQECHLSFAARPESNR
jgi:hypothetical protein